MNCKETPPQVINTIVEEKIDDENDDEWVAFILNTIRYLKSGKV